MVKKIVSVIVILLILLITGVTIHKLVVRHNEKLYNVLYSEIKYKANRCYLEEKCGKNIILKDLYDKGYLEVMYDPISKEELDKNLKIEISDDKIIIDNN